MELLPMSLKRISAAILSIVFILGPAGQSQTCPFPDTVLLSVPFNSSKFTAVQIPGTRSRVMLLTNLSQPSQLHSTNANNASMHLTRQVI